MNNAVYKPIWQGDMMYVRVSTWCQIFRQTAVKGQFDSVDIKSLTGHGSYNITIEVPYIYIGPHKNGENYSLSMRVIQIVCEPAVESPIQFHFKSPELKPEELKKLETKGRRRKNTQKTQDANVWVSLQS